MRTAIAPSMRGQLKRRIDVAVIQVPDLVVTNRLAAATTQDQLAAADPSQPLAATASGSCRHESTSSVSRAPWSATASPKERNVGTSPLGS